jgi:hypothetical protein
VAFKGPRFEGGVELLDFRDWVGPVVPEMESSRGRVNFWKLAALRISRYWGVSTLTNSLMSWCMSLVP